MNNDIWNKRLKEDFDTSVQLIEGYRQEQQRIKKIKKELLKNKFKQFSNKYLFTKFKLYEIEKPISKSIKILGVTRPTIRKD